MNEHDPAEARPQDTREMAVAPPRDFFVGWDAATPSTLRAHLRAIYGSLLLAAAAIAFVLAVGQNRAPDSHYGPLTTIEGVLTLRPYPALLVATPGMAAGQTRIRRRMLVGPWPGGLGDAFEELVGHTVRLSGRLVYRDGVTLVEVDMDSVKDMGRAPAGLQASQEPLGFTELRGYIWDARCYLGAMRPAVGKAHRGCSIRNIREGIAPLFVASLPDGGVEPYVLLNPTGGPIGNEILPFVGLPVYAIGMTEIDGGVLHFRTNPDESMLIVGRATETKAE